MIITDLRKMLKVKLFKITTWIKNKTFQPPVKDEACKNCGTIFSGHYCPECGQSEKEINRPFSIVFYDFLGNILAFDTRFWKTFINLIYRPGFLTKEFFAGRRTRYAPPLRFFVFVSFILFLLLQVFTNRSLNSFMYSSFSDGNNINKLDSTSLLSIESELSDVNKNIAEDKIDNINLSNSQLGDSANMNIDVKMFRDASNLYNVLNIIALNLEERLKNETDTEKRQKLIEYINLAHTPQMAVSRILKYMSWAFFLLLPVFALILKLFYIRRKQFYIKHLIFSIHLHSFIFIVFIVLTMLYGWTNLKMGWITFIFFLAIVLYFILALKRFYRQGFGKVILKFFGISFLYNIIFMIAAGLVFLNALSLI